MSVERTQNESMMKNTFLNKSRFKFLAMKHQPIGSEPASVTVVIKILNRLHYVSSCGFKKRLGLGCNNAHVTEQKTADHTHQSNKDADELYNISVSHRVQSTH